MSEERDENSLFGRLSWPEEQQAPEAAKEQANLEKEQARAARTKAKTDGVPVGLLTTRRVIAVVWATVCGIQILIWGLVSIIGGDLAFPWWLWTVGGGGLVVGGLWLAIGSAARKRRQAE
ncbi:hypothetical protein [Actinophytocola sp.]|uniref:hypothetical protein n=1 Tax=Actinophytocola sp. TaxID=1872138 RepID=UPI002ED418B7